MRELSAHSFRINSVYPDACGWSPPAITSLASGILSATRLKASIINSRRL